MPTSSHCPLDAAALREIDLTARGVAKRFGLGDADRDDVVQDLSQGLLRAIARFDPQRATWRTYRARVLEKERLLVERQILARRRRDARVAQSVRATALRARDRIDGFEGEVDLRDRIARLSARRGQICIGLLADESVSAIARRLDVHRATVHRELVAIRAVIRDA